MQRIAPGAAAIALIASLAACVSGPRSEGGAAAPSAPDRALVQRGAVLAAIGNCRSCHTAPDGKSFAGGVAFRTPFGTIYSTNITAHASGIGRWTEADFARAMREGIDRGGHHLYPVFPYDHFTHVTDEDNRAIHAYLRTRPPVDARAPPNHLMFPFNVRSLLAVWKRLYFKPGPVPADPTRSAAWNRGAYLVEGLGHCGACHTPRNSLGAEKREHHFDGGEAEGWHAYAINARSQSPVAWTEGSMVAYLKHGWEAQHGVSRGPMAAVTADLGDVPDEELHAMATYVVSLMKEARPVVPALHSAVSTGEGARIYAGACEACHEGAQPLPFGGIRLAHSIGVTGESPLNLINVILYGLPPADGATAPLMPAFDGAFDDRQVVELAAWLRAHFTDKPPWPDLERKVVEARQHGAEGAHHPAGGTGSDPATLAQRRIP